MARLETGITRADAPQPRARHMRPSTTVRRAPTARTPAHARHAAPTVAPATDERVSVRRLTPQAAFLVLWLVFATLVAVLAPLGAGFDEPMHLARVGQLARADVLPQPVAFDEVDPSAIIIPATDAYQLYGGQEDAAIQKLAKQGNVEFQQRDLADNPLSFPWWTDQRLDVDVEYGDEDVTWAFPNTAINSPVCYLPYVLGYAVATQLTSSPVIIGIVTRLCGVALFGAAVTLAIRRAPIGKWLIAAVALSPLSLLDHAFATADTMTFAATTLYCAEVLRMLVNGTEKRASWAIVIVAGLVIALAKLSYLPFGLLLLLVPAVREDARNRRNATRIAVIFAAALAVFALWYLQIKDINTGAMWYSDIDPDGQASFVISNPLRYAYLYVRQLFQSEMLALEAPFSIMYPNWLIVPILVGAVLADLEGLSRFSATLGRRTSLVSLALLALWLLVGFLIILALYLQFTPVGSLAIEGVQSRYFLPLVVPFMVAVILPLCPRGAAASPGHKFVLQQRAMVLCLTISAILVTAGLVIKIY